MFAGKSAINSIARHAAATGAAAGIKSPSAPSISNTTVGKEGFRKLRQAIADAWEGTGVAAPALKPWVGHTCSSRSRIRPITG